MSPKAASTKHITQEVQSPKNYRPTSIADGNKSTKKMKPSDDKQKMRPSDDRQKMDAVRGESQGQCRGQQETKGYAAERSRVEEQELTVG